MHLFQLDRNCTRCEHFDARDEQCKLWGARPPAKVIVTGCEKFDEGIPF